MFSAWFDVELNSARAPGEPRGSPETAWCKDLEKIIPWVWVRPGNLAETSQLRLPDRRT